MLDSKPFIGVLVGFFSRPNKKEIQAHARILFIRSIDCHDHGDRMQ